MNKITNVLLALAVALAPAAPAAAQAAAGGLTRIGSAAAVRGAVKAAAPGSVGRVVESGKPLYLNDHVTTDAAGRLQIMLLDETVFTIGPSSDMVLDEFVYDPATSAGKVSASIVKGTFRFVTGKVARKDPDHMKVKLAVGTIGVRGSIGVGETGPGGSLVINGGARNADDHEDGAGIYAESKGKRVDLTQPGAGTRISPDGAIAKAAFFKGDLDRIMGTLKTETAKTGKGPGDDVAGHSASEQSGKSTAQGGAHAYDAAGISSESNGVNAAQTVAALYGGIPDGIATWDQVRSLSVGTGMYTGSGGFTCSGGNCSGSTGTANFTVNVDFANQKITGGSILLSGATSDTGSISGPIFYTQSSGATGQAVVHLVNGSTINSSSFGNYNGTTLSFVNKGGTVAKGMTLNLTYLGSLGANVSGTINGGR